jgi:ssDNA-binding Zn-finger/Zn-ribbon topoisomerase 1
MGKLAKGHENTVCPICGKPLRIRYGRSLITLFVEMPWVVCEGWPKCEYSRLYKPLNEIKNTILAIL